jgi:hypothetical protein
MSIMKIMFGFMIAVMTSAAILGCAEQAAFEEEAAPELDEQGRRIVSFSVPTQGYSIGGGVLMSGP